MNKRLKYVFYLLIISVFTAYIAGCNIFDFASDSEPSPTEKAEEAIREGNYEKAKKLLADSVKDSTDSYALYLDAKATLHGAGVDISEIVELIEGQSGGSLAILDMFDDYSDEKLTDWYQANMKVSTNLSIIFDPEKETTGPFEPDDITLDYTVSNLISGVLGIRDTNQDGEIDYNDFQLNLNFLNPDITEGYNFEGEGFNFEGGTFEDEFGNEQNFTGLEVFLGEYPSELEVPAQKISATLKGKKGYTPKDINKILKFVLQHLEHGSQSLISLLNKGDTTFDTEEIEEYLNQIALIINFYWHNDGEDNDDDGNIDEEWIDGIDNDGDGLIDEDSDYTDPAIVLAPDYNWKDYFPEKIENNNTDYETKEFYDIWFKWYEKQKSKNK